MNELSRFRNFLGLESPPWLCFLHAERARDQQAVMSELASWCPGGSPSTIEFLPACTPEQALGRLLTEESDTQKVLWLTSLHTELTQAPFGERTLSAWRTFLLRLNERRQILLRNLRGGLVLPIPTELREELQRIAPDLWTMRSIVLDFVILTQGSDAPALAGLFQLFQDLFNIDELRRFLGAHTDPKTMARLPTDRVSLATYAEEAVSLLRRDGRIDASLFTALLRERPQQLGSIVPIAAHFDVRLVVPRPAPSPITAEYKYIERIVNRRLRQTLSAVTAGPGAGMLILAGPPKCGKNRVWHQCKDALGSLKIISLDLPHFLALNPDAAHFYNDFARTIFAELGQPLERNFRRGNEEREFTRGLERLLRSLHSPFVLHISNTETMLEAPYGESFFSLLRHWHHLRASDEAWRRMTVILLSSLSPEFFLTRNPHISPFNVAENFILNDFALDECAQLWVLYGGAASAHEVHQIYTLTRGHPLLTQQAMRAILLEGVPAETLIAAGSAHEAFTAYLQTLLASFGADSPLRSAYRRLLEGDEIYDPQERRILFVRGVVRGDFSRLKERCPLIGDFFRRAWRVDTK